MTAFTFMRKLLLYLLLAISINSFAQRAAVTDSLKRELDKAQTTAQKVYILDILSRAAMNIMPEEGEKYGKQLIEIAEESRDRGLMVKAYQSNGMRCGYLAGNKNYVNRAIEYFNQALSIARENKMEEEVGATLLHLSRTYLAIPDNDKALSYATQATSILSTLNNDSLRIEAYYKFGDVCLVRNDNTCSEKLSGGLTYGGGFKKGR
jgi:tetratricopeptide (TPR) repeat protein